MGSKELIDNESIVVNYKVKINNYYYNENNDFYKYQSNNESVQLNQYVDFFIIISPLKKNEKNDVNIICQIINTDLEEDHVNINNLGDKIKNIINQNKKYELKCINYEYAFLIKND